MTTVDLQPSKCVERHVNEEILTLNRGPFRNKTQSPLRRLADDLRNEVYQHTIGGDQIHSNAFVDGWKYVWRARPMRSTCDPQLLCQNLALTQVCRQSYIETKDMVFTLNVFAGHPRGLRAVLGPRSKINADKVEIVNAIVAVQYKGNKHIRAGDRLLMEMLAKLKKLKHLVVQWDTLRGTECAGTFFAEVKQESKLHFPRSSTALCELKSVRDSLLLRENRGLHTDNLRMCKKRTQYNSALRSTISNASIVLSGNSIYPQVWVGLAERLFAVQRDGFFGNFTAQGSGSASSATLQRKVVYIVCAGGFSKFLLR
ncbi:hypothetical protein BDU57DRAFT_582436 [Ampelomyces quisqualis]|uniref:Uncharacterized protein n=1 Tax=Ampelomyces quisqualis TaxID=50730 RepID=A0A6A5QBR4_AMPQU|nr:hypothetical protein BDU57DRAFT_582436 [Ampelomyces quisqualis]